MPENKVISLEERAKEEQKPFLEQLLVAAASQCHMLSYLHHAAVNGVVVTGYVDHPTAVDDRIDAKVATASTRVPPAVASDEMVAQSVIAGD